VQLIDDGYDAGIYLAEHHPGSLLAEPWETSVRFRRFSIGELFIGQLPLKTSVL
jgi:hypothetical protein